MTNTAPDQALQRMLIRIEYDGTGLVGWQRQDNGPSVQAFLEQAAKNLPHGQLRCRDQGEQMPVCMPPDKLPTLMYLPTFQQ